MHAGTAVFVANRAFGLATSRVPLLTALHAAGKQTVAVCAHDEHVAELQAAQCTVVPAAVVRGGVSPVADYRFARAVGKVCAERRPELVHLFNAKPVILGAARARRHCKALVATITGLGHAFIRGGVVRVLAGQGYRRALPHCDAVVFQNADDRELFVQAGWVPQQRTRLIAGSGVDMAKFQGVWERRRAGANASGRVRESADARPAPRVLMATRLLHQKGVMEFARAARAVRAACPRAEFTLAGERDAGHPDSLTDAELAEVQRGGHVRYVGWKPIAELLAGADLMVVASYREGLSRVALEAAACGVPAVVTDAPGVRDTVEAGVTGMLVPAESADAIAHAVIELAQANGALAAMGARARERVQREFSAEAIVHAHMDLYRSLGVRV